MKDLHEEELCGVKAIHRAGSELLLWENFLRFRLPKDNNRFRHGLVSHSLLKILTLLPSLLGRICRAALKNHRHQLGMPILVFLV